MYAGGAQLTEKAKEIAELLGKSSFKASRGWLDKWKNVTMLNNLKSVESLLMSRGKPWIHGRRGFWKLSKVTKEMTFGM